MHLYVSWSADCNKYHIFQAFSLAEEHLGIPPKMSSHDFVKRSPDNLALLAYISLFYEVFKNEQPAGMVFCVVEKLKAYIDLFKRTP